MPNTHDPNESTGREAYSQFADRYAEFAPTKAHNALYELDKFVEPQPLKEMKAKSERLYAELSHSPAFICIRARC